MSDSTQEQPLAAPNDPTSAPPQAPAQDAAPAQSPEQPPQAPAAPVAPPAPKQEAPKTFLQQFNDLQAAVAHHGRLLQEVEMAFSITGATMNESINEQQLITDQLQAIYLLSEEGKPLTRVNVANKVNDLRILEVQARLKKDEEENIIRKIDTVSLRSIIVYDDSQKNEAYAVKPVSKLPKELSDQLVGKKAGDTVGTMKITAIYEMVPQTERQAAQEAKAAALAAAQSAAPTAPQG